MTHTENRGKRNVHYVQQCYSLRTTIPELCGMCPLTASDWNLHWLNNCSTQSVVVYCHFQSKSSADQSTGTAGEKWPVQCCYLRAKNWLIFFKILTDTLMCATYIWTSKFNLKALWCYKKIWRTYSFSLSLWLALQHLFLYWIYLKCIFRSFDARV